MKVDPFLLQAPALYRVWRAMHDRCNLPSVKSYPDYGGRGIRVCARWSGPNGFANFLADMGPRPAGMTVERKDNNRDYSPSNCLWASRRMQGSNKRNNRFITANGETLHLAEWARRLGCTSAAILMRVKKGMSEQDAVTLPIPARPNSRLSVKDVKYIRRHYPLYSAQVLAEKFGVSKKTVLNVIHRVTFMDVD